MKKKFDEVVLDFISFERKDCISTSGEYDSQGNYSPDENWTEIDG